MRFLIYGLNFSPELVGIGKYTGELAQTLVQRGHQVTVITAPPYYPAWQVGEGYRVSRYTVEELPNLKIIRCPLWIPRRLSGMSRVLHLVSFAVSSALIIRREAKQKPDLIFTVAPTIVAARAAARAGEKYGIPTWLHIQDFEVDTALKLSMLGGKRVSKYFQLLSQFETGIYKHFDRVSSISRRMVERLQSKGVLPEISVYLPNWVDSEEIHSLNRPSEYRTHLGLRPDHIVVLYSGSMSYKQGLEVILVAARMLSEEPSIQFVLCGEGPAKQDLQKAAIGLTNVHILPLQPVDRLNELLNLADIHAVPQKRGAADLVMPSKLLGILASGKPVIAGCSQGSELYSVVSEVGIPIEAENSRALTEAIRTLAANPIKRDELGAKGRQYAIEHFSKEKVIDGFIQEAINLLSA